jgi:phosphoribosylformylglycinamidine cyclo-ligase
VTYSDAGVSIHAGERAVELLKTKVQRTSRPEVVGDLGGFAGLFRFDVNKYRKPLLASSTDGVGTKLVIAQQMDVHDTGGRGPGRDGRLTTSSPAGRAAVLAGLHRLR